MDNTEPRHVDRRDQGLRRQRLVTQAATAAAAVLSIAFGWVFAQGSSASAEQKGTGTEPAAVESSAKPGGKPQATAKPGGKPAATPSGAGTPTADEDPVAEPGDVEPGDVEPDDVEPDDAEPEDVEPDEDDGGAELAPPPAAPEPAAPRQGSDATTGGS